MRIHIALVRDRIPIGIKADDFAWQAVRLAIGLRLACSVSRTRACESSIIKASRSLGYCGSSGTYAPPDLRMPSSAITASNDRCIQTPTLTSGATPKARRRCAS